jgi:transcriptional regulator CtsR
VQETAREYLDRVKSEWVNGSAFIFGADSNKEDHQAISKWILGLLDQEVRSEEEECIVRLVYHSLNFDIPFRATASVRAELLQMVRIKIGDTSRK